MTHDYDFLVFIGRFQPIHLGHLAVVHAGLARAGKLIVLLGSASQPRTTRNPWNEAEREQMLRACLSPEDNRRVIIAPVMDVLYNDEAWVRNVQMSVQATVQALAMPPGMASGHPAQPRQPPVIGLIGDDREGSCSYSRWFPQWGYVSVANLDNISATPLREALVENNRHDNASHAWLDGDAAKALPAPVSHWLRQFCNSPAFDDIAAEAAFIRNYRKAWDSAPYTPMFITVDALVVQSGHLLMIERKARPGKGLWALPGGFLDSHENIPDACLRELREETCLCVPAPVLKGAIRRQQVFDAPYRSARGRTVTHAFLIELEPARELPVVQGGDDARQAFWLPLADLDPRQLFEDHYHIIRHMLGL